MKRFTTYRLRNKPWQLWPLVLIAYTSAWQIVNQTDPAKWGISMANIAGASIALISMTLRDKGDSRVVERWAYLILIWGMSCYLALAMRFDGWWGLVHQPNFGVGLSEAVVLAAVHRVVWNGLLRPWCIKRQANKLLRGDFEHDSVQLKADPDASSN